MVKKQDFSNRPTQIDPTSATISILSFLGSIFFLQSNFTGNVISNLNNSTSNIFGTGLFLIAIISGIFAFKKK